MCTPLVSTKTLAVRRSPTTEPLFRLGINTAGLWVICDTVGRKGGLFRTRAAAIKYARSESVDGNFTIVHEPDGLELAA